MAEHTCHRCQAHFLFGEDDQAMLKKLAPVIAGRVQELPHPTHCPDCRMQRRLSWRNERHLYRRTCQLTGREMLSCYSPDKPFTVYAPDVWNGDGWDPLQYGRTFDFHRPFFEQFADLQRCVPRLALHVVSNENSEYVNLTGFCKNCYLLFAAEYDEDCFYGSQVIKCLRCMDCDNCFESQDCYEVTDVEKCNGLCFARNCSNCSDSLFLQDCKGCHSCLLCANLRHQEYCIFNHPVGRTEYERVRAEILQDINAGRYSMWEERFREFCRAQPCRASENILCEGVTGDYLKNSRALHQCYDLSYAEDCRYTATGFKIKDLMDVCHTTEAEFGYEGTSFGYGAQRGYFTHGSWTSHDVFYCDVVQSCHDCFGCVSLKHSAYCILNKQYSKAEYENLVPKIIGHMRKTREWGENFPVTLSPFAYNETMADEWFPLSQEDVAKQGWAWKDPPAEVSGISRTIAAGQLPLNIAAVPDDLLQWAIRCKSTGKAFKIIRQELAFYRRMGLPVPRFHPDERHRRRMQGRNPRRLFSRTCPQCGVVLQSTYSPERPERVLCEVCILKEVY